MAPSRTAQAPAGHPAPGDAFDGLRARVDARLDALVPRPGEGAARLPGGRLRSAMRRALLAPGKRARPLVVLLAAEALGGGPAALDVACALEMLHAASLALDDLPCMDDAPLRRGRPSLHRACGEAAALLAALGLIARAFEVVAAAPGVPAEARAEMAALLARAVGVGGLVGGQADDLLSAAGLDGRAVEAVHARKTGALFSAAAACGAVLAGAGGEARAAVDRFAKALGLAFQALDDIDDAAEDPGPAGACAVAALGEAGARAALRRHVRDALAALDGAGDRCGGLRALVERLFGAAVAA